jgi:hypothetical protein
MFLKNGAGQFITFVLIKTADGTVLTGASPTIVKSGDGAAQGAVTGAITENAGGQYELALSQADVNYDEVGFLITAATAIPINLHITTETKKIATLNDLAAGAEMDLIDDCITLSKYDESTAFPLEDQDTGASQVARVGADGDTLEILSDEIAALPTDANVTTQCALALSNIHMDHLLGTTYAGEGTAGSILKDLLEDDGGTYRFTENALEQAPEGTGGDATEAKQDEILVDLVDIKGSGFVKDTDSLIDLAHIGADADTLEDISDQIDGLGGDATEAKQDEILVDLVDIKGTNFVKDTHSLYDIQTELVIVDGNVDDIETLAGTIDGKCDTISTAVVTTLDGIVDAILVDTQTTLDTIVDSILTDTETTIPATIATLQGVADDIKKLLRGDLVVDNGETPYEYLILEEGTSNVLVTKEMYEVDDTNITALTQVVGKMLQP